MTTPPIRDASAPAAPEMPEEYRRLIAAGQAHGIIGRPGPRQANTHREHLGIPTDGPRARWTVARIERWRDRELDHLDQHLLRDGTTPTTPGDRARVVLALADVAVRDTWLIRFARAPQAAQEQAADRLAAIAPSAPESLRAPIGTVLALAEWAVDRDTARDRLDWATNHGQTDYRLAQLTRGMLDADLPATVFTHSIAGTLTEQECRHPGTAPARPTPEDAGRTLSAQGWALHVDTQVDLPSGIAWTGLLTHNTHPVASVSRHDPAQPPVLYFPPGSREQAAWDSAVLNASVPLTDAIAGLDHIATTGNGHTATSHDPLNPPALDAGTADAPRVGRAR